MRQVKITKTSPTGGNIEEGHTVWGRLDDEPTVGRSLRLFRHKRKTSAGYDDTLGVFITSPVEEILPDGIRTKNSTYKIEDVE